MLHLAKPKKTLYRHARVLVYLFTKIIIDVSCVYVKIKFQQTKARVILYQTGKRKIPVICMFEPTVQSMVQFRSEILSLVILRDLRVLLFMSVRIQRECSFEMNKNVFGIYNWRDNMFYRIFTVERTIFQYSRFLIYRNLALSYHDLGYVACRVSVFSPRTRTMRILGTLVFYLVFFWISFLI